MTPEQKTRRIAPKNGTVKFLRGLDGCRFRTMYWPNENSNCRGTLLVLPGATEFIEKYFETINDALERNFSVYCVDWRGQGLSDRALFNPHKHHYANFDSLVEDLDSLANELINGDFPQPLAILAHSMGGHVALRYLSERDHPFERAIFSAPMVDIRYAGIPAVMAKALIRVANKIGFSEFYAIGQGNYGPLRRTRAAMLLLTSDRDRFEDTHYQIALNPDLALGGQTYGWLQAALLSIDELNADGHAEKIDIPITIVQAGADRLIDNARQKTFGARVPRCAFHVIDKARHELLKENDQIRRQFWSIFDNFFGIEELLKTGTE
jgi:lysophospholipase